MSMLGNRVERVEDEAMLTVGGNYVADLRLPGMAHAVFVTSTVAHGRIDSIDRTEARAMPGVLGVFVHDDLGLPPLAQGMGGDGVVRTVLAHDRVRYVGEPIVAVVAETLGAAVDAAEMVTIDYDPLPSVVDARAAASAALLHDDVAANTAIERRARGEIDFSECDIVVDLEIVNQRVAPCPIEARAATATWEHGRLVQWASSQGSHEFRDKLAEMYGLDRSAVRVVTADVGGGFGAKGSPHPEELAVAALSRGVDRPVSWVETRSQNMVGMVHGRGQVQK